MPRARPPQRAKIRVGVVSGYFRHHSVWKIPIRGWLLGLDQSVFEIVCYHTGAECDGQTEAARGLADCFVQGPSSLESWVSLIEADACDVLLYPEIGMDPMCAQIAALRLARVQCNGLGHPVTSGLSTIDLALSSELMETPDADAHYTERLVRLPGLGVFYDHLALPPAAVRRAEMGLADDAFAFWCGQSLFKYQPRFDETFAEVAAAAPRCRFVFIGFQAGDAVTEVFAARLSRTFAARGLAAPDFCLFLPRQSAAGFVAAAGRCDAILDSIGWSGFNSTIESLAHDLPIVTMEGPFYARAPQRRCLAQDGPRGLDRADTRGFRRGGGPPRDGCRSLPTFRRATRARPRRACFVMQSRCACSAMS